MPNVVDIGNSRSPKKSAGKPKPPPGPKPGILIGLGIAVALSLTFVVWFFFIRDTGSSTAAAQYGGSARGRGGTDPGAGAAGTANKGTKAAPGLPGDGG